MSNNLKKYSFSDLLKLGKLRIPKIQRDYAQGRQSQKVDEIRKVFVHSLLLVVKGKRPSTELDFVYGSNLNNAFPDFDYASPILKFPTFHGQNRHFCLRLVSSGYQTRA